MCTVCIIYIVYLHVLTGKEKFTSTPLKKERPSCARNILENSTFSASSESKKHELTPESKKSGLPTSKRRQIGRSLNAREISTRQADIYSQLREGFEESKGSITDQSILLEYLHLDEGDKSLLTRAVKTLFPRSELKRIRRKDHPETYQYLNVATKTNLNSLHSEFDGDPYGIRSIKLQIEASEETMQQMWVQLTASLQESPDMTALAGQYARESLEHDKYVAGLIKLYEKEIQTMNAQKTGVLSAAQKSC